MQTVGFDDVALSYLGRWTEDAAGMVSAWQGGQLRFKVSGASYIAVIANVVDPSASYRCTLAVNIDQDPASLYDLTTNGEIFSGQRSTTVNLPDTGEHSIAIKTSASLPSDQWAGTAQIKIWQIQLPDGATITPWAQGQRLIGFIGDSWMGTTNDWPIHMDQLKYTTYPISFGGATANTLDQQINYVASGNAWQSGDDPDLDAIVINASVNDYVAGVSLATFRAQLASVVDKVIAQHPVTPIYLLQCPRNTRDGLNYDQYGPEMATIAATRDDVTYVPLSSDEWPNIEWAVGDPYHLSSAGKVYLAGLVEAYLDEVFTKRIYIKTVAGMASIRLLPGIIPGLPTLVLHDGIFSVSMTPVVGAQPEHVPLVKIDAGVFRLD